MCCNPQVEPVINETVDQFVTNGRMFTAFEVSLAVKEACNGRGLPVLRHSAMRGDVKRYIDQYVQSGHYHSQMHSWQDPNTSENLTAELYFPDGADPSQYKPLPRLGTRKPVAPVAAPVAPAAPVQPVAAAPAAPAAAPAPASQPVVSTPSISLGGAGPIPMNQLSNLLAPGTDAKNTDKFGRLNVPTTLVKEAGFTPGRKVHVYSEKESGKPCLVVTDDACYNGSQCTEYTVEPGFSVKIRPTILKTTGLGTGPYEFAGKTGLIRVRAKS